MRILLALDGSQAAMDEAVSLARLRRARLTALFVLDATWNEYLGHDWLSGSNSRGGYLEYARDDEFAQAEQTAAVIAAKARGLDFTLKTAAGRVSEEIIKEAKSGYDLLVMANPFTRGLEIVRDAPAKVVKAAPCSVLLVKAG